MPTETTTSNLAYGGWIAGNYNSTNGTDSTSVDSSLADTLTSISSGYTYTPITNGFTSPYYSATISPTFVIQSDIDECKELIDKCKKENQEFCEKTDKHIDELESDIEFLNKNKDMLLTDNNAIKEDIGDLYCWRTETATKLSEAEAELNRQNSIIEYLITEIHALQGRLDEIRKGAENE